jgi:predicted secreted Zn-dependent protease
MTEATRAKLVWRRSSRCESGLCVEVAFADEVYVRDAKQCPDGPQLSFDRQSWRRFIAAVNAGELSSP